MRDKSFFEISKEQSRIKAAIVSKYFEAWAIVMMGVQDRAKGKDGDTIAYIDLFAGPGRYDDGTKSTPLLILLPVTNFGIVWSLYSMTKTQSIQHL